MQPEEETVICPMCGKQMKYADYFFGVMMFYCEKDDIYKRGTIE